RVTAGRIRLPPEKRAEYASVRPGWSVWMAAEMRRSTRPSASRTGASRRPRSVAGPSVADLGRSQSADRAVLVSACDAKEYLRVSKDRLGQALSGHSPRLGQGTDGMGDVGRLVAPA